MDTSIVNVLVGVLNKVKFRYNGFYDKLDKYFDALDYDYKCHDHIRRFLEFFHYYNILGELNAYYEDSSERDELDILKEAGILTAMHSWRQHKKVYQFDPDLTDIIIDVDISTTKVNHNFWNKLPFNGMCIHINDCKSLYDENQVIDQSIFVCIDHFEKNSIIDYLSLYVLDMKSIDPDKDYKDEIIPYMDFHIPLIDGVSIKESLINSRSIFASSYTEISNSDERMYYRYLMRLLNLLMYVLSANADIQKPDPDDYISPKAKEQIELDFDVDIDDSRDVEIMEVGVNIGKAIRLHKKEKSNASEEQSNPRKKGSKRIPHMRSGHWHHYWRGPRDQPDMRVLIVKWVMPVFINGYIHESKVSNITPVVAE